MKKLGLILFSFLAFAACAPVEPDPQPQPEPPTPPVPEITVETSQMAVPPEGGEFSFTYNITNPSDTASLSVSCGADWVLSPVASDGNVSFSVGVWDSLEESRTATMLLEYPGAQNVEVSIVQSPSELPACPVQMYIVSESYYYARVTWIPENDNLTYISLVMDKETYDSYESEEALFADDVDFYQRRADAMGMSLEEYVLAYNVFYQGGMTEMLDGKTPGTDYVVYSYAAELQDGALVRTSAVGHEEFRTKEIVVHDAAFNIDAQLHSNRMTLNVSTDNTDFRFGMTLFSESDWLSFADTEAAAEELIWQLKVMVEMGGLSWEDVTCLGEGSSDYGDLIAGNKYYAVACGIDDAVLVSNVATREFVIPMPEITDNCTFAADFINVTQTEMDVTVTPSNGTTRYLAVIKESSFFSGDNTPEAYAAKMLYDLVYYDAVDWSDTDILHTGVHTFNSNTDVIDPQYLKADTEYTLLVFGVNEFGERTTGIGRFEQRTPPVQDAGPVIDIRITSVEDKAINAVFTPSIQDANYHYNAQPWTDFEGKTPEEFMEYVIRINGEYLTLYQGTQEHRFTYYFPREEYIVFAFGYDGQITSDLYMKRVNMTTGEVTEMGAIPRELLSGL